MLLGYLGKHVSGSLEGSVANKFSVNEINKEFRFMTSCCWKTYTTRPRMSL